MQVSRFTEENKQKAVYRRRGGESSHRTCQKTETDASEIAREEKRSHCGADGLDWGEAWGRVVLSWHHQLCGQQAAKGCAADGVVTYIRTWLTFWCILFLLFYSQSSEWSQTETSE